MINELVLDYFFVSDYYRSEKMSLSNHERDRLQEFHDLQRRGMTPTLRNLTVVLIVGNRTKTWGKEDVLPRAVNFSPLTLLGVSSLRNFNVKVSLGRAGDMGVQLKRKIETEVRFTAASILPGEIQCTLVEEAQLRPPNVYPYMHMLGLLGLSQGEVVQEEDITLNFRFWTSGN
jgi:hypothetical protein